LQVLGKHPWGLVIFAGNILFNGGGEVNRVGSPERNFEEVAVYVSYMAMINASCNTYVAMAENAPTTL
jgi:hypothetical protein